MKAFPVVAAIGVLIASGQTFAQTPQPKPPAAAAPKPAAPQTPAPKPAAPAPAAAPVVPFPEGSKFAFIDFQRIIGESAEGKAASTKVKALEDKKLAELNEKRKQLQTAQTQLQSGGTVLSDAARIDLERKVERLDTDVQRATQDAQKELQELQAQLQVDLQRKLNPIVNEVATEKGLHMVFSAGEAGLAWANIGLDLTGEIIKKLDARK